MRIPTLSYRGTHPLAVAIVESLELNDVGMSDDAHDL